jgi:predicted transcriptional regulator of viral defense system
MQEKPVARTSRVAAALDRLQARGVFRTAEAEAAGITQPTLSRLVAAGEIIRLGHGLFRHPDAKLDPAELDYIVACERFGPAALIGGLTALFDYQLTSEPPSKVWVVVPPTVQTRNPLYRVLRSTHDPAIGVEERGLYRIASLERAVVEALAYAKKVGILNAAGAARTALSSGQTTEAKLLAMAEALGVKSALVKRWEVLVVP